MSHFMHDIVVHNTASQHDYNLHETSVAPPRLGRATHRLGLGHLRPASCPPQRAHYTPHCCPYCPLCTPRRSSRYCCPCCCPTLERRALPLAGGKRWAVNSGQCAPLQWTLPCSSGSAVWELPEAAWPGMPHRRWGCAQVYHRAGEQAESGTVLPAFCPAFTPTLENLTKNAN